MPYYLHVTIHKTTQKAKLNQARMLAISVLIPKSWSPDIVQFRLWQLHLRGHRAYNSVERSRFTTRLQHQLPKLILCE